MSFTFRTSCEGKVHHIDEFGEEIAEVRCSSGSGRYPEEGSNMQIEISAECNKPRAFWTSELRQLLEFMENLEAEETKKVEEQRRASAAKCNSLACAKRHECVVHESSEQRAQSPFGPIFETEVGGLVCRSFEEETKKGSS